MLLYWLHAVNDIIAIHLWTFHPLVTVNKVCPTVYPNGTCLRSKVCKLRKKMFKHPLRNSWHTFTWIISIHCKGRFPVGYTEHADITGWRVEGLETAQISMYVICIIDPSINCLHIKNCTYAFEWQRQVWGVVPTWWWKMTAGTVEHGRLCSCCGGSSCCCIMLSKVWNKLPSWHSNRPKWDWWRVRWIHVGR